MRRAHTAFTSHGLLNRSPGTSADEFCARAALRAWELLIHKSDVREHHTSARASLLDDHSDGHRDVTPPAYPRGVTSPGAEIAPPFGARRPIAGPHRLKAPSAGRTAC